jgi:hypothetical protein
MSSCIPKSRKSRPPFFNKTAISVYLQMWNTIMTSKVKTQMKEHVLLCLKYLLHDLKKHGFFRKLIRCKIAYNRNREYRIRVKRRLSAVRTKIWQHKQVFGLQFVECEEWKRSKLQRPSGRYRVFHLKCNSCRNSTYELWWRNCNKKTSLLSLAYICQKKT